MMAEVKNIHEHWQFIDVINLQIKELEKERDGYFKDIADYKRKLADNNRHLIGKRALCVSSENQRSVECICTGVVALADGTGIRPLFSRKGVKCSVDSYEWID